MKKIFTLIAFIISLQANSQSLISTSGSDEQGICWTIGETITETLFLDSFAVNQGFNQPDFGLFSDVIVPNSNSTIYVYPNPVSDCICINFSENNNYSWQLANVNGQNLMSGKSNANMTNINIGEYSNGLYILLITYDSYTQPIKIIKK